MCVWLVPETLLVLIIIATKKSLFVTALLFHIQGATKDIQQLFTAIDRRIEALRRNSDSSTERDVIDSASQSVPQALFDEDDKESFLGEQHSSPESSPECHVGSRTRHAPTINMAGEREKEEVAEETQKQEEESREIHVDQVKEGVCDSKQEPVTSCEGGGESDKDSATATPPSSRSPSLGASTTTTVSSSTDNTTEANFSQ